MNRIAFSLILLAISMVGISGRAAASVTCGSTIVSDVKLESDLTCPAGAPALMVGADDVTINLKGHTIRSDSVGGFASAIRSNGQSRISIINGTIVDYGFGVWLQGGHSHLVNKMKMRQIGSSGIVLDGTDNSLVRKNELDGSVNHQIGIFAAGNGNVIEKNRVHGFGIGISLIGFSSENLVTKNSSSENGDGYSAVLFSGSANNTFLKNLATENTDDGYELLVVDSGTNNTVTANVASNNAGHGFLVSGWIDGGKNRATGNGEADCVGVVC